MLNLNRPTLNLTADDTIESFQGPYRFLSNFYLCPLGDYPSVEHAFQAAKPEPRSEGSSAVRERIRLTKTPGKAKRIGRTVKLRSDWEDVKQFVMLQLLREKFRLPELRDMLLATGDAQLIEGNDWHDYYWGVCNGVGENHLGKLLMLVRSELRGA